MEDVVRRLRRWRGLLYVLALLIAAEVGTRLLSDLWERHSPDDYRMRVEGCASSSRDLVFVGGSTVSEGIVPEILSGTRWSEARLDNVYAVGLPGATTSECFHAVKLACPAPPRMLVYGITASDLNDSRHEPHGPASLMNASDLLEWAITRPDSREWVIRQWALARLNRVSAIFRYRHGIRMWATDRLESTCPGSCADAAREAKELKAYAANMCSQQGYAPAAGFVNRSYEFSKAYKIPTPPFHFLDRYRTGSHLLYLHKLMHWAGEHRVALILVDMPVTSDLEVKHPEAFAEYRRVLEEVEQKQHVTVVRAHRDRVGITDAGFADMIHLNHVGATVLSNWLRVALESLAVEKSKVTGPLDHQVRAQMTEDPQ